MRPEHFSRPRDIHRAIDVMKSLGDDLMERGFTIEEDQNWGGLGKDYSGFRVCDLRGNVLTWAQIIFSNDGWQILSSQNHQGRYFIETVGLCFAIQPEDLVFDKWDAGREPAYNVHLGNNLIMK